MKIMIIDDSEIEIFVSTRLLRGAGMVSTIYTFLEAREGLDFLIRHKHDPETLPDIILLDIHMPLMNGFEFIQALEVAASPSIEKIKIYIVSSTADQREVQDSLNYRMVKQVFGKPLDVELLLNAISES